MSRWPWFQDHKNTWNRHKRKANVLQKECFGKFVIWGKMKLNFAKNYKVFLLCNVLVCSGFMIGSQARFSNDWVTSSRIFFERFNKSRERTQSKLLHVYVNEELLSDPEVFYAISKCQHLQHSWLHTPSPIKLYTREW